MKYNKLCRKDYGSHVKRNLTMDEIDRYIDMCLIDEYADKDFNAGYSLDVDSLSNHTISNFLDLLMQHDTTVRDLVRYNMQKLIDARLPEREVHDRENVGLTLVHSSNGDTSLHRRRNYYAE